MFRHETWTLNAISEFPHDGDGYGYDGDDVGNMQDGSAAGYTTASAAMVLAIEQPQ